MSYYLCHILKTMQIFEDILRASPDCKKALITWLVLCFASNSDRGKMFHQGHEVLHNQANDAFFMNLSWIMLRLCSPFMVSEQADATRTARVKAIDVSYCVCSDDNVKAMSADAGGPLVDFSRDSKLVPHSDGWLITHMCVCAYSAGSFICTLQM